jgi:hypothetical protein
MSALVTVGMLTGDTSIFALGIALQSSEDDKYESRLCIIRPIIPDSRIDFASITETSALHRFRFTVDDIFVFAMNCVFLPSFIFRASGEATAFRCRKALLLYASVSHTPAPTSLWFLRMDVVFQPWRPFSIISFAFWSTASATS